MRKGVSLVEVLIACVVLAIVVAGFILAVLSVQRAAEEARVQAIVAAFCNYKFTELETHGVSYIYQTYGEPQQEQVTDGFGHTLLSDTVTVKAVGDDTDSDGKPDKYYGSPDLVCVQIIYEGKVMGERVFGDTDPYSADEATSPDIFYADFSADPTSGTPPLTVQFQDLSSSATSTIVSWSWNFGDGGTSTERNPSHIYSADGVYTVMLTVTDNLGRTRTCTKTDYIIVGGVKAQFVATPTTGNCPLTVTFSDNSIGVITNWRWDFGDGTTLEMDTGDHQQNVSHTYNSPGTYTVTLRVQQIEDGEVKDEDTASTTISVKAVLAVKADSSDGTSAGVPSPDYGFHPYDAGTAVNATCGQNPYSSQDGERYVCLGWKLVPGRNGQPSEEGSGTSVYITMDRNYELTWKWQLQYELTVTVDDPLGHGSVMKTPDSADGWYNAGTSVTLLAAPSDEFRQWTGDASGTNPQITITMDSAKDITAIFNKFKLTVTTDPSVINPTVLDPPKGDNWLPSGSKTCKASLHVGISDGARYRLTSYTGTGSAPSSTVPLTVTADPYEVTFSLNQDSSIAWKWGRFYRVTASVSLPAGGSVIWNIPAGTQYYIDNGERWFEEGSSISLTAKANTYYHFVEWQENGVRISTDATLNLNSINSARSLVAVFAKDRYTLFVRCKVDGQEVGPPSEGIDSPEPPYGDHLYDAGPPPVNATIDSSTVTNDGTRWVFQGWEQQTGGSTTSGSGNSVSITMTADTFLYWRWKTQYRLQLAVTKGGTVDVTVDGSTNNYTEGTYILWFDEGTVVTLEANPGSSSFACWFGDCPSWERNSSEITITMDEAKTLKAVFGVYKWWLDAFSDTSKLASQTNTEVSGGYLQLAKQPSSDWDPQAQMWGSYDWDDWFYDVWSDPVFDEESCGAQTFVPSITGDLTKVKAIIEAAWGGTATAFVEIRTTDSSGCPTDEVLATSEHIDISSNSWQEYTFTFTSPASVTAGQRYAIVWRAEPSSPYHPYLLAGNRNDVYSEGMAWFKSIEIPFPWDNADGKKDFAFMVYIESSSGGAYYSNGDAVSVRVPESGTVTAWYAVWVIWADVEPNTSLAVYVLDADTNEVLGQVSLTTSAFWYRIDLSGVDASEHHRIKLKAEFTSDGSGTPKFGAWVVQYYILDE